jgi:hypothetical protein
MADENKKPAQLPAMEPVAQATPQPASPEPTAARKKLTMKNAQKYVKRIWAASKRKRRPPEPPEG